MKKMKKMEHLSLITSLLLLLPLIAAAAAAVAAVAAAGDVALISPEDAVILPSQDVVFRFNPGDSAQNCTLVINGMSNKTAPVAQSQAASLSAELNPGQYNWSVLCNTNASQQISSPARKLAIDVTPPEVRLITPSTTFNASTAALTYYAEDENLKNCTLLADAETQGTLKDVKTNLAPVSGKNSTFLIDLQDRQYKWFVRCADKAGNANPTFYSNSFRVDTTPPSITALQPSSVVTSTTATMALTTSEDSECRYSPSSLQNYSSMTRLSITGERQHQQPLSFQNDGAYPYYVVCQDSFGNSMEPRKVEIAVHLLPAAKISLSDSSPVKAGIIEATLLTSKSMSSAPILTYNSGGKEVAIALSGQNDVWKGHFLIEDNPDKKIATFSFKGTDTEGYTGTAITEGKSFIIDTIKPSPPGSLKAEEKNSSISLSWYLSQDIGDVHQYRVYRSANPSPDYLDLYVTVNGSPFIDNSVQDKVTYYYRVAALDSAGNLGELSETAYATARTAENNTAMPAIPETKPAPPLPPQLVVEVNDAAKKVENIKLTIEGAVTTISSLAGKAREISDLAGVKGQAEAANTRLEQLMVQLESLKKEYKETNELRSLLKKIIGESNQLEKETVKDIKIEAQIEDLPIVKKEQMLKAIDKAFTESEPELGKNSKSRSRSRDAYVSKNGEDLQDLRIKSEAAIAQLIKANGASEEKSLITHYFNYAGIEPAQDSLVIIFVPKPVASSSKELTYPAGKPEVLQDDPVLKWGFLSIGPETQKISYIVNKKLSDDEVRSIEVVPLLNINKIAEAEAEATRTPAATGLTILANIPKTGQFWMLAPGLLIVLALGGYYLLMLTTPKARGKEKEREETLPYPVLKELDERLSSIQAEIDEEIYPILVSIRNSMLKLKKEKDDLSSGLGKEELIIALIGTAKNYAAASDTDKARSVYPAIQLLYQSLNPGQKARFGADCVRLRQQLGKRGD